MRSGPEFLTELVRGYFVAVADGRWDDVLGLFQADAVLNVAGRRPKVGTERIRPFYENLASRFERYQPTILDILVDGGAERGTAAAILTLNAVSAAGEPIEVPTADHFVIDGGSIRSLRIIFDTQLMR
jgi:ketosteroid isomerase-like protein